MSDKRRPLGKKLVMKPIYRMKVEKDKKKYNRKEKNKGHNSGLYDILSIISSMLCFRSSKVPVLSITSSIGDPIHAHSLSCM